MEALNPKSIFLLIVLVVAFLFVLNLVATWFFVWFGWTPPKFLSGLFNAPQWLIVLGWAGIAYLIASALFDVPGIDLFPAATEGGVSQ